MHKEEWNGPAFKYEVFYKLASDPDDSEGESFFVEDSQANHTIIRDQPIFQKYLVKVQAWNEKGRALKDAEWVVGYSGEAGK